MYMYVGFLVWMWARDVKAALATRDTLHSLDAVLGKVSMRVYVWMYVCMRVDVGEWMCAYVGAWMFVWCV